MAESCSEEPSTTRVSQEIEGSVAAFSKKTGLSEQQTLSLIEKWGNDHSVLTEQARRLSDAS